MNNLRDDFKDGVTSTLSFNICYSLGWDGRNLDGAGMRLSIFSKNVIICSSSLNMGFERYSLWTLESPKSKIALRRFYALASEIDKSIKLILKINNIIFQIFKDGI